MCCAAPKCEFYKILVSILTTKIKLINKMEPVVWRALPGAAGVVVRSGSGQVGTSVLHLPIIILIFFVVLWSSKMHRSFNIISSVSWIKILKYLSPLQKQASAQRASIVFIWSLGTTMCFNYLICLSGSWHQCDSCVTIVVFNATNLEIWSITQIASTYWVVSYFEKKPFSCGIC